MKIVFLLLTTITSCFTTSLVRFDGYEVYKITPETERHLEILYEAKSNFNDLDFWIDISNVGSHVDVMVPPYIKERFLKLLVSNNIKTELWIENVQQRMDNEKRRAPKTSASPQYDWSDYQTLDELYTLLDIWVKNYPTIVTPISAGWSYEGREIRGVKLSFGPGKKGVFLEGGIHANEWVSPSTVTFIVDQLLTSNNDTEISKVARSRDWHVFPSVNPDGYVYTHLHDRTWRKNRKPYGDCVGVDLNRNWDYYWMRGGGSNDSCSKYFVGSSAFSENETRSLSEYIRTVADSLDVYLAMHSYSQILLIPFGHDGMVLPENNEELHRIGKAAVRSLYKRYRTKYRVGNVSSVLYVASGTSMDWILGLYKNVRLTYTYELRDMGKYGYYLPPEQIIPTGEETLDSIVRMIQELDRSVV